MVLLQECENAIEATSLRAVLESQGIECVAEGDRQSYFVGLFAAATIQPRVLVMARDLERARALLSSQVVPETTGEPFEGGLCPVHETEAIAICGRCGSFLCVKCQSIGAPPVCESCIELETSAERSAPSSAQPKIFFAVLGLVLILLMISRVVGA